MALLGLFWAQFAAAAVLPDSLAEAERVGPGVVCMVLAAVILVRHRGQFARLPGDGFRASYADMAASRGAPR